MNVISAFNATLTIVALLLCSSPHGNDSDPSSSYAETAIPGQALKDILAEALSCLPLIDTGNRMVDKCAQFAGTLNHCLHLLGKSISIPVYVSGYEERFIPNVVPSGSKRTHVGSR